MKRVPKALLPATIVFALAVPAAFAVPALTPAEMTSLGESLKHLTVGPSAGKITLPAPGHLKLVGASEARTVRLGDGRSIGYFFPEGTHFDYDPSGPGETAIRINFDRVMESSSPGEKGALRIRANFALWITSAPVAAAKPEESASIPPVDASTSRFLERFGSTRFFGGAEIEPAILIAEGILASRPSTTVAILYNGKGYCCYVFDPEAQEEVMTWAFEKLPAPSGLEGWLTTYRLDRRPVARTRKPTVAPVELRKLDVDLEEQANHGGRFKTREEFAARRPTSVLRLRLDEVDIGFQTESIHIEMIPTSVSGVRDGSGNPLPYLRIGNGLLVAAPPLVPGGTTTIETTYYFSLRHPWGDQYWRLADQSWYPVSRDLRSNWSTFHARIAAAKPNLPFATGKTVARSSDDKFNRLEALQEHPVQFPSIMAGRYFPAVISETGDKKITVASYAMEREDGSKRLGQIVSAFLDVEEKWLGPQSQKELSVVEMRDWGWGQAPDGFLNITEEAFNPILNEEEGTYVDFLKGGVNERIAHEVSHFWWGHVTRIPSEQDQWLEESTAEYMAAVVLGSIKGKSEYEKLTSYWRARGNEVSKGLAITDANLLHWDQEWTYRFNLLYCRGPYTLHKLREELGDQDFFKILRSYLRSFDGKVAGTEELIGLINFVTKKDYRPWFDKYVYGAEKLP